MSKQDSPIWKSDGSMNKYRQNELYRRFRSLCYELARQSVSVEDPEFERRVLAKYAEIQQEFHDGS